MEFNSFDIILIELLINQPFFINRLLHTCKIKMSCGFYYIINSAAFNLQIKMCTIILLLSIAIYICHNRHHQT